MSVLASYISGNVHPTDLEMGPEMIPKVNFFLELNKRNPLSRGSYNGQLLSERTARYY